MRRLLLLALLANILPLNAQPGIHTLNPNIPPGACSGYSVPANFSTAVVATDSRTSRVYFAVNGTIPGTSIHPGQIYFNERTCTATPCVPTWKYPVSHAILTFPNASISVSDVLFDASHPFYNDADGQHYAYVMYFVIQPTSCDTEGGFLALSFSNDGENWYNDLNGNLQPMLARRYGGPYSACVDASDTVPVEAFGAVFDRPNGLVLGVGIEGNIGLLVDPANFSRTQTYLGAAWASNPRVFYLQGELSSVGLSQDNAPWCSSHRYFINLATAFEPSTGTFWISRAYPYPYDALGSADFPCNSACLRGVWTPPNRVQVFSMNIGSLANSPLLLYGSWTLVKDLGASSGYSIPERGCSGGGACVPMPIIAPQESIGMVVESVNFRRNADGGLAYTPALNASNIELALSGTSNYDYTCSTPPAQLDTQSRQFLLPGGHGPRYQGYLDSATCAVRIQGWAWDANDASGVVGVDIFDGAVFLGTTLANIFRADLLAAGIGDGRHGLDVSLPALHDGRTHSIHLVVAGTPVDLGNSPTAVFCP